METILQIQDELLIKPGQVVNRFTVTVSGTTITARDLIRSRVYYEVEQFNQKQPQELNFLVTPTDTEQLLNQKKSVKRKKVNPEKQVKLALQAFQENGFILLYNDQQIETLDQTITLHPDHTITFIKLTALIGG